MKIQKNWISYTLLIETENGTETLEKSLTVFKKNKHLSQDPAILYPHKYLHTYTHGNFICNRQTLETTQMFLHSWMILPWSIHSMEYCLEINRNEFLMYTTIWINLQKIMRVKKKKSQSQKLTYTRLSVYVIFLNDKNYRNREDISACWGSRGIGLGAKWMWLWKGSMRDPRGDKCSASWLYQRRHPFCDIILQDAVAGRN